MQTKLSKLLAEMRAGNWTRALSIAAKFPQLGEHKEAITRAHAAAVNPDFYRQLGRPPAALIEAGKAALIARYAKNKNSA